MDDTPERIEPQDELSWFRKDGVAMTLRLVSHGIEYYSRDPYYGYEHRAGFQTFGEMIEYGGRYDLPAALEEVLVDRIQDLVDPEDRVGAVLSPVTAPPGAWCTTELDRTRIVLERGQGAGGPWALLGTIAATVITLGVCAGPFGALALVPTAMVLLGGLALSLWGVRQAVELTGTMLVLETRTLLGRRVERLPLENLRTVGMDGARLVLETTEGERQSWGRGFSDAVLAWLADGLDQAVHLRRSEVGSPSPTDAPEALKALLPEAARGSNGRRSE